MRIDAMRMGAMKTATWRLPAHRWWLQARACWQRIARVRRSNDRRLRLAETLPLGERRFVAVLEFEGDRFLLGGTASSLVLLARLGDEEEKNLGQASRGGTESATEAGRP